MMKRASIEIGIVLITLLIGFSCNTNPFNQDLGNYQEEIKKYMWKYFKDPDSALYKFGTPYQATAVDIFNGKATSYEITGWYVPVSINAKNELGGYTGYKNYLFAFKDKQIVKVFPPGYAGPVKFLRPGWKPGDKLIPIK